MDVDRLLAGQRFDRELDKALSQCDVLIAVIGPRWMESLSEHARGGERDFVHDEIAAALKRDIVVIPVLIGREGHMPPLPRKDGLPEDIRALVLYQKHDIAHESFNRDADHLTAAIASVLRGGRRVAPWRAIAISGAIGLTLIAASLGYRTDLIPFIGPGAVQPHPVTDAAIVVAQSNSDMNRADEAARKKAAEETANADADAAKKNAEQEAARKKAREEFAGRQAAETAKRQADADAAKKKAEEETAGKKAAADCDRLAASPTDTTRPSGVAGVDFVKIDAGAATAACDEAMQHNPEVARFVYQAGRAAEARKDYPRAAELYRAAISNGNIAALTGLGVLYDYGRGFVVDFVEARKWYEKAAALGEAGAMTALGWLYFNGQGVASDYTKAREWFDKARALGDVDALTAIGNSYATGAGVKQDNAEARKWYEKAAALDEPGAMNRLGFMYEHGVGVGQDYAEARKWYEKAAALGEASAMNNLGVLYHDGRGVPQKYSTARGWYEKATALGSAAAMYNLGTLYEDGLGGVKDRQQARQWYQKAVDAGNEQAKERLKKLK